VSLQSFQGLLKNKSSVNTLNAEVDRDRLKGQTDESNSFLLESFDEVVVFREETITRMHSLCSSFLNCSQDVFDLEIALGRLSRALEDVTGKTTDNSELICYVFFFYLQ